MQQQTLKIALSLGLGVLIAGASACTRFDKHKDRDHDGNKEGGSGQPTPADAGAQAHELSFDIGEGLGLTAGAVTSATVQLVCDGFDANDPQNAPSDLATGGHLTVYGNPTGCTLRLLAFVLDAATYAPKAGATFTTYQPGDQGLFVSDTTERVLTVVTQLASPIETNSSASYRFSQLEAQSQEIEDLDISSTQQRILIAGTPVPQIAVRHAKIVVLSPLTLGLRLEVECLQPLVSAPVGNDSTCDGVALSGTAGLLVQLPAAPITGPLLDDLFTTTPGLPVTELPGFTLIPAGVALASGGFVLTVPFAAFGMAKVADLDQQNLIFAVRNGAESSYLYVALSRGP